MDYISVIHGILPIILLSSIGSFISRTWIKEKEFWRGLERLSFYLFFPTMLFDKISRTQFTFDFLYLLLVIFIAVLIVSILMFILRAVIKTKDASFKSMFLGSIRYNNFLLFGLGASILGDSGLSVISKIAPYTIVITNFISILVMVHHSDDSEGEKLSKIAKTGVFVKSIFTNPYIVASILGFIANFLGIKLHADIQQVITNFSNSALSIGMLIVGAGLRFRIKKEYFLPIILLIVIKLVVTPIVIYMIMQYFDISPMALKVGILFGCLPSACSSYVLAKQMGGEPELMISIVSTTTVCSIITLPIISYLLI